VPASSAETSFDSHKPSDFRKEVSVTVTFLVTALIVCLTPGTGVLFTVSAGVTGGRRAALVAAAGCTLATAPHLAVAVTGLAALLAASPLVFHAIQYAGVAYLLYLAWGLARSSTPIVALDDDRPVARPARLIASAVLVNLLNPKLTLFAVGFLPQFVTGTGASALRQMVLLSVVFMVITFITLVGYGMSASVLHAHLVVRPWAARWINRAFAGSFAVLACVLALAS
jgi:threonine/homoserine/homoserine lactone efflux protein